MADTSPPDKKPGEILTSADWNLVQRVAFDNKTGLSALDSRVAAVESKLVGTSSRTVQAIVGHMVQGEGTFTSYGSWSGTASESYGPICSFGASQSLGQWGFVPSPTLTIPVATRSVLQLSASFTLQEISSQYMSWIQFILTTSDGRRAPVRTHPKGYGNSTYAGGNYVWPGEPNADTLATWMKYHDDYYKANSNRWPMAGIQVMPFYYSSQGYQAVQMTELIEVPSGTYAVQLGVSTQQLYLCNLTMRALVTPS